MTTEQRASESERQDAPLDADLLALRDVLARETAVIASDDRSRTRRSRALALVAAAAAMTGVLLVAGVHLGARPTSLVVGTLVGAALLTAIAAWLTLGLGRSMLGRPARLLALAIVAVPVLLFAWKVGWTAAFPGMDAWDDARPGFRCLGWSLAMALGPMAAFLFLHRHTAAQRPSLLGAALGMAAGTAAWALLDLYCPIGDAGHLLLGHVLPLAVFAGLGAVLGRRVLRGT